MHNMSIGIKKKVKEIVPKLGENETKQKANTL